MELYEALKTYAGSGAYPFHMPGHKRRMGEPGEACAVDITEIDGFDNLHHAEGILKKAQEKAAALYGAEDTYYLVNGSTAGILAAVSASVRRGGKLLMARNSHKAAYHAAQLRDLRTVYLYPKEGAARILAEDVYTALEQDREIEAVFITSPTYEGIVSDVAEIARAAHAFGVPLIVDEAHGAHFGFHPDFPESSVRLGADLVVHSLHKTLPSMTQTALLHRNGSLVSGGRIQKFLDIYQTSSPSYVMMASMDTCIDLLRAKGDTLFSDFSARLKEFYRRTRSLRHFYFLTGSAEQGIEHDFSRLVFGAAGRSGKWLADTLRERFLLEMEMAAGSYVVAITTIADTQEGFDRLLAALHTLDEELERECHIKSAALDPAAPVLTTEPAAAVLLTAEPPAAEPAAVPAHAAKVPATEAPAAKPASPPEQVLTLAEAEECPHRRAALFEAEGQICAEYIYLYPPGIPLIVPGERISHALLARLQELKMAGCSLQGMSDYSMETVEII